MDIFTPIVDQSKFHPNFRNVTSEPKYYARTVLSEWADGFIDRDGKFVKEFQTSFNSSFWELYLFACLKELGFHVDFSFDRPDFVVYNSDVTFCIEASIASSAIDSPSEWEADYHPDKLKNIDKEKIVDVATVRLANTLATKYNKYIKDYASLAHVQGKPFIIAIAPFEQPFSYLQNEQAMSRVLYSFDKFIYQDFPDRNERIMLGQEYMDEITKPNGTKIPLGFFIKPEMTEISAVVFSNTATFGKVRALSEDPGDIFFESIRYNDKGLKPKHTVLPKSEYHETLLDGLHIFHNPFATHPISYQFFERDYITQHDFDLERGIPLVKTHDGFLFQRSVNKIIIPAKQREKIYNAMQELNKELAEKNPAPDKLLNIKDIFGLY